MASESFFFTAYAIALNGSDPRAAPPPAPDPAGRDRLVGTDLRGNRGGRLDDRMAARAVAGAAWRKRRAWAAAAPHPAFDQGRACGPLILPLMFVAVWFYLLAT
jgi:hypothetical protein